MSTPATLLEALCNANGAQAGTIHQYNLKAVRWVCERAPSTARNCEGIYTLVWTDPNGGEWSLGYLGGSSIAAVRQAHEIGPFMNPKSVRWTNAQPYNRTAIDTYNRRTADRAKVA